MKTLCVIPARLASVRLPEKVLKPLLGKPLVQHTYEKAKQAGCFDRVVVACDHARIQEAVARFGGEAVMTAVEHESGTSRIAEVAKKLDYDLYVNLQADEPLVHPAMLAQLTEGMKASGAPLGTLAVKNTKKEDWQNPNVVKVVLDHAGDALYFSRAPIPFGRDQAPEEFLKHLGLYAYRRERLLDYGKLIPTPLEPIEKLEQLRFIANGYKIRVWVTPHESVGVDTEADFRRVEAFLLAEKK